MCGIAGIVSFHGSGLEEQLIKSMIEPLHHRGPDDDGVMVEPQVGFGFKRLSIIDISGGHQPMTSTNKEITIVFNGEIYNFADIKSQLMDKGRVFQTHSDTEVIICAYQEWGIDCLKKFNGMFAFALYDRRKKEVYIVRDRMGIKPLYITEIGRDILFASEIKSFLAHPKFERRANYSALSSYLTFRYPMGDQPVFDGVRRLTPGSYLKITPETTQQVKYWEIPFFTQKDDRGEGYYLKRTEQMLKDAVKRRMISDVPLGAFLSGGLDSSIVVSMMSQMSSHKVKTFSIGFEEEGYNELEYAQMVADHCRTEHHGIILSHTNYVDMWHKMIRQKDAPLSIPHEIALYRMCVELKKHITVVISGEGADELFGGYGRVQRSPMDYKKIAFVRKYFPSVMRAPLLKCMGAGAKAEKMAAVESHMQHFFHVYNWVPFEEKWDLFTDQMNKQLNHDEVIMQFWQKDFEHVKEGDVYDQILYMFEKNHLLCLLDRLDSMSMAASVEARVPFVDHELIEFVSTIPHKYKMKWRSPAHKFKGVFETSFTASEKLDYNKKLLRDIGKNYVPKEIFERKKLGFPVPLDSWIKQGMMNQAREILLDSRAVNRGIFKKEKIEALLNNPQNLNYDFWGKKIWMLMNIELWFKEFIDQK